MKKIFEAVLVAVLMLGFSACQNEPEGEASIVGSWVVESVNGHSYFTEGSEFSFAADGTGSTQILGVDCPFTWVKNGNNLNLRMSIIGNAIEYDCVIQELTDTYARVYVPTDEIEFTLSKLY